MGRASVLTDIGWPYGTAGLRTYGAGISNLWTSAGFTKTSDTGQIDWTTATNPGSAGTLIGYEIRKLTNATIGDTYCRMDFKTSGTATAVVVWMTVGTGTDGAGNLTGVMNPNGTVSATNGAVPSLLANSGNTVNGQSSGSNYMSYCSVDDGSFLWAHAPSYSSSGYYYMHLLLMSLTCDETGTYNRNGLLIANAYNNGNTWMGLCQNVWSKEIGQPGTYAYNTPYSLWQQCYPYYAATPSIEVDNSGFVVVGEMFTPTPNWFKSIIGVNGVDAAVGTEFDVSVLGANRHYLSLGGNFKSMENGTYGTDNNNRLVPAILWEA